MSWVDGTDSSNVSPRSRRQICVLPTRPSAQGRSTCCASRKRDCPYRSNLTSSYYQRWALATELNVVERGLAGADELEAGHALRAGKTLKRKLTADVVEQGMTRGSFFRQSRAPARFKLGDRVRTKNIHPPTHTRLPRYARGRFGVVELVHGCHAFPDAVAIDKGDDPQWLYTVVFDGRELWGADADPTVKVSIDAFEPYLDPA